MIDMIALDEERIDAVTRRLYGTDQDGGLEALLAANPGLAALGPVLPRGTRLVVPPRPQPAPDPAFRRPWE